MAKLFLIDYFKQNPNPNGGVVAVYEDSRVMQRPLDMPPNGPKHDTWSNGPKDGVVAPWQILDADL